jgi:hypothetical protein
VTGIWFWGGGRLSDAVGLPATIVSAASGRVGDLARGVARHAGGSVDAFDVAGTPSRVVERAQSPRSEAPRASSSRTRSQAMPLSPPSRRTGSNLRSTCSSDGGSID